MSDSENQGAKWQWLAPLDKAEETLAPWHPEHGYITTDYLNALEATITTLKAQLKAAEIMLRAIAEADTWGEGDGNLISALKVDIPADGYPRQHIQQAAQRWLRALSAPTNEEKASDTKGTNDVAN